MNTVRSDQLLSLADRARACGATILSLDCFDTLVWRTTAHPTDVFNAPPMRLNRYQRMHAEGEARKLRFLRDGKHEVTIRDIYRAATPAAADAALDAAIRCEQVAEAEHCFGFPPTMALIRAAKSAGMQVIIVSDTYLPEPQLRALVQRAVGDEVAALIDRMFCSCEYGVSKAGGLFKDVLGAMGVDPQRILHVGDNRAADFEAPRRVGIHAVHLEQFTDDIEQQLRLEATAAAIFDPAIRASRPFYQPQRPLLSRFASDDPGVQMGFATLGPVLFGFGKWLQEQARLVAGDGAPVKLLFMMRDGYLPKAVYDRIRQAGDAPSYAVEISRFTAFAASLRSEADIDRYIAPFLTTEKFQAMATQLLFTQREAGALERSARAAREPQRAFVQSIKSKRNLKLILERAEKLRQRFAAYLRRQTDIASGDRVMLVDLGYAGTVQDRIAPVMQALFDVDVCGRYLLLRDLPGWQDAKRGYIGPDKFDGRAIDTLCDFIALFEQLCTIEQGSVVDYTDAGEPVRKANGLASRQSEVRTRAQRGCLEYIDRAAAESPTGQASLGAHGLRPSCLASLARLLFFPSAHELELFKGFEHDVNMGVDDRVLLFDSDACRDGLRSRGLFYVNDNPRQFLPAELRSHGLPLTLTLLAQRRFGLDLRRPDFDAEPLKLPVMVVDATRSSLVEIDAQPTHDGYYVALIPIGRAEYSVGIVFGRDFERVQLHDALVTAQNELLKGGDRSNALDVLPTALLEGVLQEVDGVLVLESESAFIYFHAPPLPQNQTYVLSVSFRPLQRRALARVQAASAEMVVD
jgi:FMN phosphatase YigB (HAD superfamily)